MMGLTGVKVKVLHLTDSFVSFRYIDSNARSRMKKEQFMRDYQEGTYDVVNPEFLAERA